jgi:predicted tellurium resistance membrane protein TerC
VKLLAGNDTKGKPAVDEKATLYAAVRTIIAADIVMSLDNVLAMAAAAKGHIWMLAVGLAITIPLLRFGSAYLMRLMERFPFLIFAGAAVIGYVAGEMLAADPAVKGWIAGTASYLQTLLPIAGAIFVVATGTAWQRLRRRSAPRL